MSLPPYNPDANCPKCQTKDISTRYYPEGARRISGTMSTGEHLARHCRTCSFNWDEGLARDHGLSEDVTSYLERYGLHPVTKWAKTYQKRVWFAYFSIEKAVPRRGKMFGRSKKLRAKDRK